MTTVSRVYNFSSGPAVLPLPVLEEIQRDMMALPGSACRSSKSAIVRRRSRRSSRRPKPTSARSPAFPSNYKVLFLQGGASTQFSMVPMNLLTAGATADYIDAGSWAREGDQGSEEGRQRQRRRLDQERELLAHPARSPS